MLRAFDGRLLFLFPIKFVFDLKLDKIQFCWQLSEDNSLFFLVTFESGFTGRNNFCYFFPAISFSGPLRPCFELIDHVCFNSHVSEEAINFAKKFIIRPFRSARRLFVHVRGAFPTKCLYLLHAAYLPSSDTIDRLECCLWRRQSAFLDGFLFPLPQSKAYRNSLAISEHTDFWKFHEKTIAKSSHWTVNESFSSNSKQYFISFRFVYKDAIEILLMKNFCSKKFKLKN